MQRFIRKVSERDLFFWHLHDVRGHMRGSHQVKMLRNDWTEAKMKYFLQLIKDRYITTILDSKH